MQTGQKRLPENVEPHARTQSADAKIATESRMAEKSGAADKAIAGLDKAVRKLTVNNVRS